MFEISLIMTELKRNIDELKLEQDFQIRIREMNFNKRSKEITIEKLKEIEDLKFQNSESIKENQKLKNKNKNILTKRVENNTKELHVFTLYLIILRIWN